MYSQELIQKGYNLFREIADKLNRTSTNPNILAVFGKDIKANQEVSKSLEDTKSILALTPTAITLSSIIGDKDTEGMTLESLISSRQPEKELV